MGQGMKNLILDTCAVLWLVSGDEKLSSKAREQIETRDLVFVSAISCWEIALKQKNGELILPMPALAWFNEVVRHHNLIVLPLDADVFAASVLLPDHHRDPADRFIIAQALNNLLAIVTGDEKFRLYGVDIIN
jgi:PIN domain nuclease of toxin-antitoxin system